MKKLTAGILASLIGLVSANSADASVASTNYVNKGLETKQNVLDEGVNVSTVTTAGQQAKVVKSVVAENGAVAIEVGQLDYADLLNTPDIPDEVIVDDALSNTSVHPVQNKVITTKIEGMDFSAADTTGVVQTVTQEDGAVTATYGLIGTEDIANDAVTTDKIVDSAVTSAKIADGTIVDADVDALSISKITGLQTELDTKQLELKSGVGGNIVVSKTGDNDNVVTGISAADGVVTVQTGYFDHSNTEYEGVKDVAIVDDTDGDGLQEVYTEYYGATDVKDGTGEDWYVLMRKKTGTDENGNAVYTYQWENLDRSYSDTEPTQE